MVPTVLVVQHATDCPPGRVGDWLLEAGVQLDIRAPHQGEPLPPDLTDHDGLLVLGGSMGAYDDARFGWLAPTKALLRQGVQQELPTLGICLGHQLLAVAEGGVVTRLSSGPQIGVLPVRPTSAAGGDPLFSGLDPAARAVHWNADLVTTPPPGAVALARSAAGLQAFRLGAAAWAVQFHPEVNSAMLAPWAAADVRAGVLRPEEASEVLASVAAAEDELARTWQTFTARFAARLA